LIKNSRYIQLFYLIRLPLLLIQPHWSRTWLRFLVRDYFARVKDLLSEREGAFYLDGGFGLRRAAYLVICRIGDRTRVVIVVNVVHGRGAYRSRARVRLAHCRIIFSTSIEAAPLRSAAARRTCAVRRPWGRPGAARRLAMALSSFSHERPSAQWASCDTHWWINSLGRLYAKALIMVTLVAGAGSEPIRLV
jgi:hypothetical protein